MNGSNIKNPGQDYLERLLNKLLEKKEVSIKTLLQYKDTLSKWPLVAFCQPCFKGPNAKIVVLVEAFDH